MGIPLVDLAAQHREIEDEVRRGFDEVFSNTSFILGRHVAEFESAFARFSGVAHCIGVANGTDALELALRAVGVGQGDEVVVPANTFIASALAIARTGATPVFVDSDPVYHMIDVEQVKGVLSERTKAVMPVHLYGQLAPVERLESLAAEGEIALVEDAAQCQGATRYGDGAATKGRIAGTSFYPGKNIGAYGDAGAVMTNDEGLAAKVRALGGYGSDVKYHHPELGFNSRLDTLQAVVLLAKLGRLSLWNEQRAEAASRYDALLADVEGVLVPRTLEGNAHVWHVYVVRVPGRDRVLKALNDSGIGAGVHYPVPCHLQGAFAHLGYKKGDLPVAEQAAEEILSLPLFPTITEEQQVTVVSAIRAALS
jgi:dTDP-4-amino-4,6-dideoxygalactose transaminase